MLRNTVRLCFVLVSILAINCAPNKIGEAKRLRPDENRVNKDVFEDVARILNDANPAPKPSPDLKVVKLRHKPSRVLKEPQDQDMLKDAHWEAARKTRKGPRDWRQDLYVPQPAAPAYSYQRQPLSYQHYTGHPYYSVPYPGYNAWYGSQIPNYKDYNVPPETEWKTTVHEGPDVEWTATIAFQDMKPIILTNKNYSKSPNVKVIINKGETVGRQTVRERHIPITSASQVDPSSLASTQYKFSPSSSKDRPKGRKNQQGGAQPITWTAQVDYGDSPPVVYRGSQAPQVPQTYFYSYDPRNMYLPPQAAPWVPGPYHILNNPSPAYTWPSAHVSYHHPGMDLAPSRPPSGTTFYPSFGGKPLNTDEGDDNGNGEEDNGNDYEENGDGDDDDNGNGDTDEDVTEDEEDEDEEETEVPDSEDDDDDNTEDNNIETPTTEKKGLFSWG